MKDLGQQQTGQEPTNAAGLPSNSNVLLCHFSEMAEGELVEIYKNRDYSNCKNRESALFELKKRGTPICPVCYSLLRNEVKVCCGVWQI